MKTDPRVQKFYDEAAAARAELRRLAVEIAGNRIDYAEAPVFPINRVPLATTVIPDVTWALEHGRTDIAARIIDMVDQFNHSMGSAAMMQARVNAEQHAKAIQAREQGDEPEYLDAEDGAEVLRLTPEEAKSVFAAVDADED